MLFPIFYAFEQLGNSIKSHRFYFAHSVAINRKPNHRENQFSWSEIGTLKPNSTYTYNLRPVLAFKISYRSSGQFCLSEWNDRMNGRRACSLPCNKKSWIQMNEHRSDIEFTSAKCRKIVIIPYRKQKIRLNKYTTYSRTHTPGQATNSTKSKTKHTNIIV